MKPFPGRSESFFLELFNIHQVTWLESVAGPRLVRNWMGMSSLDKRLDDVLYLLGDCRYCNKLACEISGKWVSFSLGTIGGTLLYMISKGENLAL